MRKHPLVVGLVGAAVAAALVMTQAGSASAAEDNEVSVEQLLSTIHAIPAFAGYQTTSSDQSASVIITVPDADDCDAAELTGAYSWLGSESVYAAGAVVALCQPGQPGTYGAGASTPEDGTVALAGPVNAGDQIKIVITDDGTETTATVTNLSSGESVSASTPTVPDGNYEVGVTGAFAAPLVDGVQGFKKAKVDGAKLKASGPTKVTFSDPLTPTYKPSRLKKGTNFKITSS